MLIFICISKINAVDLKNNLKLKNMKDFIATLDFLEKQQEENSLTTYQLHMIIQTMATFIKDEDLKEIQNVFNIFKN
jgi:hypothetical protein